MLYYNAKLACKACLQSLLNTPHRSLLNERCPAGFSSGGAEVVYHFMVILLAWIQHDTRKGFLIRSIWKSLQRLDTASPQASIVPEK